MHAQIITVKEYQNLLSILEEIKSKLSVTAKNAEHRLSEKWLTIDETCKILNISRRTLQSYRDNGILSFSQFQGKIYFKTTDIENHLLNNYKPAFAKK